MVSREGCTEVSGTAKVGTDEQERHMRLFESGKVAHHTNAQKTLRRRTQIVDAAAIDRRIFALPREVCVSQRLSRANVRCIRRQKSAEVIVVGIVDCPMKDRTLGFFYG